VQEWPLVDGICVIRWISLFFACALLGAGVAAAAGRVVGRLVVSDGRVYLQAKGGKPIVVPQSMEVYQGDIFTTPVKVSGYFQVGSDRVPLAPLTRYRIGADGVYVPDGRRHFTKVTSPQAAAETPMTVQPIPQGVGLVAKVRVILGNAFQRTAVWPQELPITTAVSLNQEDELRLEPGAVVQIFFVQGGWIYMRGPALLTLHREYVSIAAGEGYARGVAPRHLTLGPYRIDPGPHLFTFKTVREGLEVGALGGIITVSQPDAPLTYVAPGRCALLARGAANRIVGIDIRKEIRRHEAWLAQPDPDQKKSREPDPNDLATSSTKNKLKEKADVPRKIPKTTAPEKDEAPDGAQLALTLRDRMKGMESPRNRWYYIRKRDVEEKKKARDDYYNEIAKKKSKVLDEAQALRMYRLDRAWQYSRDQMGDFQRDRELTFEERLYVARSERDRQIRAERERLFGEPLFITTRRLSNVYNTDLQQTFAQVTDLRLQLTQLQQTNGPAEQIDAIIAQQQSLLTSIDLAGDALKEEIRVQVEPYR
jgi:hypothetical protein